MRISEDVVAFKDAIGVGAPTRLSTYEQNAMIEFLKTLQVLPPGTKALVVDEHYQPKAWPPIRQTNEE